MKALYHLIQCFKDKGLEKFANTDEVSLGGRLSGGGALRAARPAGDQGPAAATGRGALAAPADSTRQTAHVFQTCFCPSSCTICIPLLLLLLLFFSCCRKLLVCEIG